jgi:hypothetical protein
VASGSGDCGVAEYRLYTVDGGGHFRGFELLVCANDAEAIDQAKRLVVGHAIEFWCGERLVIRLEAKAKKGASGVLF